MIELALQSAPEQLSPLARAGWTAETTANPEPGDIWLMSWNGSAEGLTLVTSVYADFVLGMPITIGIENASEQEVLLNSNVLGAPATLWLNAETGLGLFLLHRRVLAGALSPSEVTTLRRASRTGEPHTLQVGASQNASTAAFREVLLSRMQALCFLEWPRPVPGEGTLDRESAEAAGLTSELFIEFTGLPVPVAYEAWTGQRVLPAEIMDELSERSGVTISQLLKAEPDEAVRRLEAPLLKELIFTVSMETGQDERDVRNAARSSYALAARTGTVVGREIVALTDALNALRPKSQ